MDVAEEWDEHEVSKFGSGLCMLRFQCAPPLPPISLSWLPPLVAPGYVQSAGKCANLMVDSLNTLPFTNNAPVLGNFVPTHTVSITPS